MRALRLSMIAYISGPPKRAYWLPSMTVEPSGLPEWLSSARQLWPASWRMTTSNVPSVAAPSQP